MVIRHGAVLGLAEIAKVVGEEGLSEVGTQVRTLPVSLFTIHYSHCLPPAQSCS